jgi:hypothetical protein
MRKYIREMPALISSIASLSGLLLPSITVYIVKILSLRFSWIYMFSAPLTRKWHLDCHLSVCECILQVLGWFGCSLLIFGFNDLIILHYIMEISLNKMLSVVSSGK